VTLFADDPLSFKKLVYEMRFDEASAKYALFRPVPARHPHRPAGTGGHSLIMITLEQAITF